MRMHRLVFFITVMLAIIIFSMAIIASSIAATTSFVSTFWFIPGAIILVCNFCVLMYVSCTEFYRIIRHDQNQNQNQNDESRWDGDTDIDGIDGTDIKNIGDSNPIKSNKITFPHPRDPRLRDACLFCLEPLQRDYISTRLAVLDDDMIVIDFVKETLIRPCNCGYSLHAQCALECLARSNKCIVCKKRVI